MTRTPLPSAPRARATVAAAVLAAAALTGCAVTSPIQTDHEYVAGDGQPANLGDVHVRNLLVVSKTGETGTLSGGVTNSGTRDADVTFDIGGEQIEVTAKAGESSVVQERVTKVGKEPGDLVEVVISVPGQGDAPVSIPVLDQTGYYETVTPSSANGTGMTQPSEKSSTGSEDSRDAEETSTPSSTPSSTN